jgi:hypothetical protein
MPPMDHPITKCLLWTLAVSALALVVVFGIAIFTPPPHVFIDCNGRAPISLPLSPDRMVFTGKILTTLGPCETFNGRRSCSGAVARVQEKFSGVRSNLLLLTQGYLEKGQEYLIDGDNFRNSRFTRFLPIVSFTGRCNHSARLEDADVDLRILRDKSPPRGVRIIGKVIRLTRKRKEPLAGTKVVITGPQGTIMVETDNQGIYDAPALPPGHYEIHSQLRGQDTWHTQCWNGENLKWGQVGGCTMFVEDF